MLAILPGLVDSHVHINDPGRSGVGRVSRQPTRAAAAGGYTMLVDMPLNCLPATTSAAALCVQARGRAKPVPRGLGSVGRRGA